MQGRVFTLVGSLGSAMGLIVAGPVADAIGVQSWYVIGGVACILMAVVGYSLPAVMNIEDNHRQAGEAAQDSGFGGTPLVKDNI
jgi:DHA3 family macrolide efflux protein-like MFS transporter